jgi:hypothetical protein
VVELRLKKVDGVEEWGRLFVRLLLFGKRGCLHFITSWHVLSNDAAPTPCDTFPVSATTVLWG